MAGPGPAGWPRQAGITRILSGHRKGRCSLMTVHVLD